MRVTFTTLGITQTVELPANSLDAGTRHVVALLALGIKSLTVTYSSDFSVTYVPADAS